MFSMVWSSVGRKFVMALTGLCLIGFVTVHLAGNLTMFVSADLFNTYSHHLISLGPALWVLEIGLLALFAAHAGTGVWLTLSNWRARGSRYVVRDDAGGASRKTFSSTTMIYTGALLFIFIIIHVWMFKYGAYYETTVQGASVRDLFRLVFESFQSPVIAFGYVAAMIVLGLHLKHAFWSAFQSLGLHGTRWTPFIYGFGTLYAVAFAFGFLVFPIWMYFRGSVGPGL